jgi:hypothetical protein
VESPDFELEWLIVLQAAGDVYQSLGFQHGDVLDVFAFAPNGEFQGSRVVVAVDR